MMSLLEQFEKPLVDGNIAEEEDELEGQEPRPVDLNTALAWELHPSAPDTPAQVEAVSRKSSSPQALVLDRHDFFASRAIFANPDARQRRNSPREMALRQRSRGRLLATGSTRSLRTASSRSPPQSGVSWSAASSNATGRSGRSCGVEVRPWALPRQDTIPDPRTGRRMIGAPDPQIRIFLRLPGKGRLALWVDPDLPIGPEAGPHDLFTELFGEDAEIRGPYARKPSSADGRLTPVRALLARRQQGGLAGVGAGHPSSSTLMSEDPPRGSSARSSAGHGGPASLKALVEAATGVPIARQKLVFGRVGPLDDHSRALCDYNIGHGALLYFSARPEPSTKKGQSFLASPKLADMQEPGFILDRMGKFMTGQGRSNRGKDVVECLPDWRRARSTDLKVEWPLEQQYFDYQFMPDNHIFDLVGRVRKRFGRHDRAAKSAAAWAHAETPPHTAR